MKPLSEILSLSTELLGWTLLNSLWQGLVMVLLIVTILRFMPVRLAKARYAIACMGIVALLMISVYTFLYLQQHHVEEKTAVNTISQNDFFGVLASQNTQPQIVGSSSWLLNTITLIDANMSLIMMGWAVGALLFSLRLISGWWYIRQMKQSALEVDPAWNSTLETLANAMGIRRVVMLAQSTNINSPMVIGFFKPVILIPAGMLAGLSTEQVETIILHELAHIKRHDYIINLLQAFVETLFFFNPFVWVLSNIIRREREYCCDDEVIMNHGSTMAYARALAQLEEWRLTKQTFALSLAENKNQLLNRIRRIMEKSGQNYSAKDRLIPAVLLVVGLICASWLTIKTDRKNKETVKDTFAQDTVIKNKGSRSKTTIITFDSEGNPHEEVYESAEGDVDEAFSYNWMSPDVNFVMPDMPSVPGAPSFPSFPDFPDMPMMPSFSMGAFHIDTIPGPGVYYFNNDGRDWENFSEEFEKKFQEQFKDFYKDHQKEFEKMMEDMKENFSHNFEDHHSWQMADLDHMREMQEMAVAEMHEHQSDLVEAQRAMELAQLDQLHALEAIPAMEDVAAMEHSAKLMEEQAKEMELRTARYEKEVAEMAKKDGYLGKDEKLSTINWGEDNEFKINGKKIKAEDTSKYVKHRDKYFKSAFHYMKTE